ncbi:MAG TPA: sugar-transfer associated ATP-grasp domain-containing protein [Opitutus sp.]|nr:sugar-transfer associated ATP-grasp domain-containing protein [Opitutus sp.]
MSSRLWSLPVFRLIATDRCRVAAPWFVWTHGRDGTSMLRALAITVERSRLGHITLLEQVTAAIAYFPLSVVTIVRALRRWGRALLAEYGVSRTRQCAQLAAYVWRVGLCPRMYYQMRLHRHSWKKTGRHFIDQPELHHLQRLLAPTEIDALEDKLLFSERASRHGLPIVPILAIWREGSRVLMNAGAPVRPLPPHDIFVKPAVSYSSAGVMGFRFNPATGHFFDERRTWTPAELTAHLDARSRQHALLVQPWLRNARELRGFSDGALCNFRVVTGRHPGGRVRPVMAALRFPWRSRLSCAEPGITLCAGVALESGLLSAAEAKEPAIGRLVRHPVTGQQIEGFRVPSWGAILESALAAHAHWAEFPFIGWDIALADDGIRLLEGSSLWGGALAQMSGSAPLGLTAFPEIYLANLAERQRPVP